MSWITDVNGDLREEYVPKPYSRCMNCGESRREVGSNGGWCDLCSGVTVPETPCLCGCLAKKPPASAYVDYWESREGDK